MSRLKHNLRGQKFFRLTVGERAYPLDKKSGTYWEVKCECGNSTIARSEHLRTGKVMSCGCYGDERRIICNTIHGAASRGLLTPTYRSWESMKKRCSSPDEHHKKYYTGITVCERWINSFENFLSDMGERPKGKTLDRYPNRAGNYEPGNCRWATHSEQMINRDFTRFITIKGETHTCSEWGAMMGISSSLISRRINKYKWTPEDAVLKPVHK